MKKAGIFNFLILIILIFIAVIYDKVEDKSLLVLNDKVAILDNNEISDDDYVLDDFTLLDDENVDLARDFLVFNNPNNLINDENVDYLKVRLGLSENELFYILNYDNTEVSCEFKDNCYFGTGMKIVFSKHSSVTDNIDEDESVEDFDEVFDYPEYGDDSNNSDDTSGSDSQDNVVDVSSSENVVYYIVVIGDITGDGKIEINDIAKSKDEKKWNSNSSNSSEKVSLNALYKRALSYYRSDSKDYLGIVSVDLARSKVFNLNLVKVINKNSYNISIKDKDVTIGLSDIYQLNVETEGDANIHYSSSNEKIATVNEKGVVTARQTGNVTISASSGENTVACDVKVIYGPKSIRFSESVVYLLIGDKSKPTFLLDSDGSQYPIDKTVKFVSSNPNVATVNEDGTVTALSEGESVITATTVNNKKATYSVVVTKDTTTNLSPINVLNEIGTLEMGNSVSTNDAIVDGTVLVGGSFKLSASAVYSDGTNAEIRWKGNNDSVATIDASTGEVIAKKAGIVTFSVTSGNRIESYTISVYDVKLGSKKINLDVNKEVVVSVQIFDHKNNLITIDNLDLVTGSSEYYSVDVSSNKITFKGLKELTTYEECNISINKLIIGTIEVLVHDSTNDNNGEVIFIPTQYGSYGGNEAILLRSGDGSLALVDTATKNSNLCKKIVKYIHKYAGVSDTEYATLKYLIVSHSHGDHVGCLSYLLENSYTKTTYLKIEKIIMKNESTGAPYSDYYGKKSYSNVYNYVKANKNSATSLVKVNDLSNNYTLQLGNNGVKMKLHLFNLADVYSGEKKCWTSDGKHLAYGMPIQFAYDNGSGSYSFLKVNGTNSSGKSVVYYPYLKYANSSKISFTTTIKKNQNLNGIPTYLYAYSVGTSVVCNPNANSIAVLAEVPIANNDSRYIYLPSDIENNGYPFIGKSVTIGGEQVTVSGNGLTYFYKYASNKFVLKDNNLVADTGKIVYRAREYKTALAINKVIDKNKIVVYQASHHGYNNDKSSVDLLNLNRKDMYVVSLKKVSQYKLTKAFNVKSYYYTLDNVTSTKNRYYYTGKYYDSIGTNGTLEFSILNNGKVSVSAIEGS